MIGRLNNSFGLAQNFQINIRHNSKIEISKENDIAQSNIPASNLKLDLPPLFPHVSLNFARECR